MKVIIVNSNELKKINIYIRFEVFVKEQNIDENLELEYEEESTNFLLYNEINIPVGTIRYRLIKNNIAKIERFAILKEYRNKQYGNFLFKYLVNYLLTKSNFEIIINSQKYLENYYKKIGFKTISETFIEANIEHVKMEYIK